MKKVFSILLVVILLMGSFSYANLEFNGTETNTSLEKEVETLNVVPMTVKKPVILVPGIGGTKLYNSSEFLWLDFWRAFWSASDDFLDPLKSSTYGTPGYYTGTIKAIYGGYTSSQLNNGLLDGIILSINGDDIFEGLVAHLEANGYTRGVNLFAAPYDWRKDINYEYPVLDEIIEIAKQRSGWDQVDIVAHSMGGLLTKRYLVQSATNRSKVDTFISLGTPYLGSPESLWALTEGDNFSAIFGIGVNPTKVKEMVKNFPANYQLMPSPMYYSRIINSSAYNLGGVQYTSYVKESDTDFDGNGVQHTMLSYSQVGNAIYNNYNYYLYSRNNYLHNLLDGVSLDAYGIDHYVVAGSGVPTLYVMEVYDPWYAGRSFDAYKFGDGDKTVPYGSAIETGTYATGKYYFPEGVEHGTMPSQAKNTVLSLLDYGTINVTSTMSFASADLNSTTTSTTEVVEVVTDEEMPKNMNGLLFLVRGEEMPTIYKKNNPVEKIGKGKEYDQMKPYLLGKQEKQVSENANPQARANVIENSIKKGSYIKQYGDIYVIYVPDADEDYNIELSGKDKVDIEVRRFDQSEETVLQTIYEIDLSKEKENKKIFKFDAKEKKLK